MRHTFFGVTVKTVYIYRSCRKI